MSRHSEIWDYFEICVTDVSRARCTICNTSLSHGGKTAFNTTNLHKHLQCTHSDKWRELLDKEQRNASEKMFLSSHQHSQHQHHINNQRYQPCRGMESHRFTCLECPLSYRHERGLRSHYLIAHQFDSFFALNVDVHSYFTRSSQMFHIPSVMLSKKISK